jgi:hypothetical protein
MTPDSNPTLIRLITAAMDEFATLVQTEFRLVRTELSEKTGRLASSGTMIAAGGAAAVVALVFLLQAVVRWLAIAGLPEEWGLLLVAVVVGIAAFVLLAKGINDIKTTNLAPDRMIRQVRADLATVKEHVT